MKPLERSPMKSSLWDYVLSGIYITVITLLSAAAVALGLPWSKRFFGDFHVLVDLLVFVLLFGALCAVAVRALWAWRPAAKRWTHPPLPIGSC